MIRVCFIANDTPQPWGDTPLGCGDAWVIGFRPDGIPACGPRSHLAEIRHLARHGQATTDLFGPGALSAAMPCDWIGGFALGQASALDSAAAEALGRKLAARTCRPGVRRLFIDADAFPETAAALAEGFVLRAMPQHTLRTRPEDPFTDPLAFPDDLIVLTTNPDLAAAAWQRRTPAITATLWARRLMTMPGNHLTPATFQAEAETLSALGVQVSAIVGPDLKTQGLNLLHAVGQGAACPPRLILLDWPGQDANAAPVVLIGKGITFDTGGISIKPADGMEEMKGDMGGSAAVIAALQAVAQRRSTQRVVGLLAVAENAVNGNATRPGDVVSGCDGTTVDIVDTDAEGRLVLADALAFARLHLNPTLMIDLATLTGAVVRTLGQHHAGLFSPHPPVIARIQAAAQACGETVWHLPLPSADDTSLKSDIADLKNCAWGVVPDAMHAAGFLHHFAGDIPWAHLDIAGVAEAPTNTPQDRKGPRGWGVRLLDRLIQDLEDTPWAMNSAD